MVIIRVNTIVPVILNARCVHYFIFKNTVEKLLAVVIATVIEKLRSCKQYYTW